MKVMRAPWKLDSGEVIDLITPTELARLPKGTPLTSINGEGVVTGDPDNPIDDDTRGGMLAYGLPHDAAQSDRLTYEIEIGPDE